MESLIYSPSDFVGLLNQTLEYAYPKVVIEGELSNFKVSKNRWVYFDVKDDQASVRFFGTVYSLPGPLEDGMMLRVTGAPRLHPQFGFSINVQSIELSGEGTIKKAFELLLAKLMTEGLFEPARKRPLPYPPTRIGLITSSESAAYADFIKILSARWGGVQIEVADVQVQGEAAAGQIARALEHFNALGEPPEVLVLVRGGGSADDLQTFNTEIVTRAVAASRIPTMVAIGHEIDTSLAELAADVRASTPSNAAELLVPDKTHALAEIQALKLELGRLLASSIANEQRNLKTLADSLSAAASARIQNSAEYLKQTAQILDLLNPAHILKRGYAVVRSGKTIIRSAKQIRRGQPLELQLADGSVNVEVQ